MIELMNFGRYSWTLKGQGLHMGALINLDWSLINLRKLPGKYRRDYLSKTLKGFFLAYLNYSYGKNPNSSPYRIKTHFRFMVNFSNWLIEKNIWNLSKLIPEDLIEYIEYESLSKKEGKKLTKKSIEAKIMHLQWYWFFRNEYKGALAFDPITILDFDKIYDQTRPSFKWKALEDNFTLSLINEAVYVIEKVCPAYEIVLKKIDLNKNDLMGKVKFHRTKIIKKAISGCESSELEFIKNHFKIKTKDIHTSLRHIHQNIKGAIIVIILFLTGIRIGELRCLKKGCLISKQHSNGNEYKYISGIAAKKQNMNKLWIVPEVVVKAIQYQEIFNSVTCSNYESLFISSMGMTMLPMPWAKIYVPSSQTLGNFLQIFASTNEKIPPSVISKLHPHRASKTFARFLVLRDKKALGALAQHYGHLYYGITDMHYVGNDYSLNELINSETTEDLAKGLMDLITSRNISGIAGRSLAEVRDKTADYKFKGKRLIENFVDNLIRQGVTLAPCDWGYCLYYKDMSACHGDEKGPNPIYRTPNTCSSCSNFAVTEKHRAWWSERYIREENFLKKKNLPEQTRIIVDSRLRQSKEILQGLNQLKINPKKL